MNQTYRSRDEYQLECVESIIELSKHKKTILCVLPTSAGKTHIFSNLIKQQKDKSFLIVAPKVPLIKQAFNKIKDIANIEPSINCAELESWDIGKVTVSTYQSLKDIPYFDYLIYDEVHCQTDEFYNKYKDFIGTWIGFTATPYKKNNNIFGENKVFDKIDYNIKISSLIKSGFITPYRLVAPTCRYDFEKSNKDLTEKELNSFVDDRVFKQISDMIERTKNFKKIAIMCINIKHCEMVYESLKESNELCSIAHSKQSKEENISNIDLFENKDARFLISVNMVSTGYDYPAIDCIVIMRPTRSVPLMIQMIGRGLRLFEGKKYCQILDYGSVIFHCGTPEKPILSGLESDPASTIKICPVCQSVEKISTPICFSCGYIFIQKEKEEKDFLANLNDNPYGIQKEIETTCTGFNLNTEYITKKGKNCCVLDLFTFDGVFKIFVFRKHELIKLNKHIDANVDLLFFKGTSFFSANFDIKIMKQNNGYYSYNI